MYLPPGVRNQSPQVYPRNFNPYVDELSAAAAALSLGGQPLIQDPQSMFPQAALHRQQQVQLFPFCLGLEPFWLLWGQTAECRPVRIFPCGLPSARA